MDFNDYIDFVNLKGVTPNDGASFSPIAPGEYEMEITSVDRTTTKKTNKPMLVIEFAVADGNEKGKTARGWYVLDQTSQFSMGRLAALLTAAGVPFDENGFSMAGLVGAHIGATVTHEAYSDFDSSGQQVEKTSVRVTRERSLGPVAKAAPSIPANVRTRSGNGSVVQSGRR